MLSRSLSRVGDRQASFSFDTTVADVSRRWQLSGNCDRGGGSRCARAGSRGVRPGRCVHLRVPQATGSRPRSRVRAFSTAPQYRLKVCSSTLVARTRCSCIYWGICTLVYTSIYNSRSERSAARNGRNGAANGKSKADTVSAQQALIQEKARQAHEGTLVAEVEDPAYAQRDSFMVSPMPAPSQKPPQVPTHYALPPDQVTWSRCSARRLCAVQLIIDSRYLTSPFPVCSLESSFVCILNLIITIQYLPM